MFKSELDKKRLVGIVGVLILIGLFVAFNRMPKLDVIAEDMVSSVATVEKCFQGFCVDPNPHTSLITRWLDFSISYLKLVSLGMIFAFLVAGIIEVFLFPNTARHPLTDIGIRGSIKGAIIGPFMNLCSACIVPVSNALGRRGASPEAVLGITQSSPNLNILTILMTLTIFTPGLALSRLGVAVLAVIILGVVTKLLISRNSPDENTIISPVRLVEEETTWSGVIRRGIGPVLKISCLHLLKIGPIMVLSGFAVGFIIQLLEPEFVNDYLGNSYSGILIAATVGLLLNVPLLFEIPLIAALILLGLAPGPATTLLFCLGAAGPITFWGLSQVIPKRAVLGFAAITWLLGVGGGSVVMFSGLIPDTGLKGLSADSCLSTGLITRSPETQKHQPIKIDSISPEIANSNGGSLLMIRGQGFDEDTKVLINGIDSTWDVLGTDCIMAYTPAHPVGTAKLEVLNSNFPERTLESAINYVDPFFQEIGQKANINFKHYRDALDIIPIGGGVVVFDYNNDGFQDVYIASTPDIGNLAPDTDGSNALYENNGDGTFRDIARWAGVDDPLGKGNGGCSSDYNNDGYQDLFVTNWGSSKLFAGSEEGRFSNVTIESGLQDPDTTFRSSGCAWGDYDNDGYLDLIVVRYIDESNPDAFSKRLYYFDVRPLALFKNQGDGTFSNETHLLNDNPNPSRKRGDHGNIWGSGFQPKWVDFDNDGDLDLYVVNDFGEEISPNVLWRNDGPSNTRATRFTDISLSTRSDIAMFGMGIAVGDYDRDGHKDFYLTNINKNFLLSKHPTDETFRDVASEAGVSAGIFDSQPRVSWGTVFFDYDNDGYEDLYVASGWLDTDDINRKNQANVLFHNNGDETFTDVTHLSGTGDFGIGRGLAYADFNNDGCLDLFLVNLGRQADIGQESKLFENTCDWRTNWLQVKTIGTTSNTNGIGARIKITYGPETQWRSISAGGSSMSQNSLVAHFGLANAQILDSLEIHWPSGIIQTLNNINVNQLITVTEPQD
ncbi:MAG: FG-GAP-like repeat-containing protein [Chloroflexota bacterium]|nr:FG-GAP-like repeat-containing protein [Chloroflexota bacterium]